MEKINKYSLLENLKKDRSNNSFISFLVLFFYRISHFLYKKDSRLLLYIILKIQKIFECIFNINTQIHHRAEIGYNIRLPHRADGVVISKYAIIYDNVTIYHQVTLGINESKPEIEQQIIINENCYLSCGCKIISCKIGKNCKIAPNAVVYTNIPNNTLVYPLNKNKAISVI